jgi:photosystem II stability/assembly factor-like uncharacterized protein
MRFPQRPLSRLGLLLTVLLVLAFAPRLFERQAPTPRLSGAERALRLWATQRAYPAKELPARGMSEAFALAKGALAEDPAKTGGAAWQTLGPHNIGGRTLVVALNPQNPSTVYAGAASGGLWRSYTGGVGVEAWEQVTTGFPVLGVSCIAIDPADSNVMYIGTGEVYNAADTQGGIAERYTRGSYGMGILKTTDGGRTWSHSLDWSYQQQRGIWAVKINPLNPSTLWAGTTEGTYKSVDAGQNWTQVDATVMVTDLVLAPADTNRVYIACGNFQSAGQGLYRTVDGGDTWEKLQHTNLLTVWAGKAQLAVCPAAPELLFASIGNGDVGNNLTRLLRSSDGGNTWEIRSYTDYASYQGWFAHDVAVDPTNPLRVFAVGIDIFRSTSGGALLTKMTDWRAWYFGQTPPGGPEGPSNYSHADHHDIAFHPTDPNIIYFATDGGIFRSTDGGVTYEGCNGGYQTQQFYAGVSSHQGSPTLSIGGMQDNSTAIYTGDLAWYRAIGGDGSCTAIDPSDPTVLYGSAQYLYLVKSIDGGVNWFRILESPYLELVGDPAFIAPFALGPDAASAQTIYAGGTRIAVSQNGGLSWFGANSGQVLDGNPALALEVSPQNVDVVYVTTAPVTFRAGVFRTDDGDAFVNVTDDLPDRYPVGLAIDPTDDRTVYVTLSGFGTSHVFRSVTGGGNWQDIGAGLPDIPTSAVVVDPVYPNTIYIGNDIGVFYTTNGGADWSAYNMGLPEAVMAMDLNIIAPERRLRVATYGSGVFERPLVSEVSAVAERLPIAQVQLAQNRPNPFNPSTVISYRLPRALLVDLVIYDAAGRRVRTLVHAEQDAGERRVRWDGRDEKGRQVASGMYLYELQAGGEVSRRKMTLVK